MNTTPTTTTTTDRGTWSIRSLIATTGRFAVLAMAGALATPRGLAGQDTNPWEQAVNALSEAMTGPLARGLSLVAIVIGGLMFAFGEGGSKRTLAGIIFGLGMAMGAAGFLGWLFE